MSLFDRIASGLGELITPDELKERVERGRVLIDEGQYPAALETLRGVLKERPDHARALYLLGLAESRSGQPGLARTTLLTALAARPDLVGAELLLGQVSLALGELDSAAEAFRRVLESGSSGELVIRAAAHRGLGEIHLAQGRAHRAVRELRKAVALCPDELALHSLLGRAYAARGELDGARQCLERVAQALQPDAEALVTLGAIYRRQGRIDDAELAYRRALEQDPSGEVGHRMALARARLGLAAVRLEHGDPDGTLAQVEQVLLDHPALVEGYLLAARAHRRAGRVAAALAAYDQALDRLPASSAALVPLMEARQGITVTPERAEVLEEAMHAALATDQLATALVHARALLAERPGTVDALATQALERLRAGDITAADALLGDDRIKAHPSVETLLVQAELELAKAAASAAGVAMGSAAAIATLDQAALLQPTDPRPRARRRALYQAHHEVLPDDLYALLRVAQRTLARLPELAELAPEATRVLEIIDRPLQLTVMGEFNSGKSTFVNAFVGEEVAPMGIVPTTATINVLKYGSERGARIIYCDDQVRELEWAEVGPVLRGLSADEARRIRLVEVRCPLELLQRINVVDTPGLNSILPEHEDTARAFIAQADAVVWLFAVGQAGSASEREALARVCGERKKVLGVLNKVDAVSTSEQAEILAHLERGFGDLIERIVPFSAREALRGARALGSPQTEAPAETPGRALLDEVLREHFFARAEAIKREAARHRMHVLVEAAAAHVATLLVAGDAKHADLAAARDALRHAATEFQRHFLVQERLRLHDDLSALLGASTREVIEFVRPRRWAFGSNLAQPADRDYLAALLEGELEKLGEASRGRVTAQAEQALATVKPLGVTLVPARDERELLRQQLELEVYGQFRAFMRGYLRGGRLDEFFARVLPRLDPTEVAIRRALELGFLDAEIVDVELVQPLRQWAERFHARLGEQLGRLGEIEALRREALEERLRVPIEELRARLASAAVV